MPHDPQFYRHLIFWTWCAWALYWLISAIGTKATQRREPLGSRLAYLLPLLIGGLLIGVRELPWAAALGTRLWPRSFLMYWVGYAILIAGIAFAVWARAARLPHHRHRARDQVAHGRAVHARGLPRPVREVLRGSPGARSLHRAPARLDRLGSQRHLRVVG